MKYRTIMFNDSLFIYLSQDRRQIPKNQIFVAESLKKHSFFFIRIREKRFHNNFKNQEFEAGFGCVR